MYQAEVVFHRFLEAGEEFPEPIVPRASTFHDPAACRMATPRDAFAATADVGDVAPVPDRGLDLGEVIPFVQTQVLWPLRRGAGALHDESVQRRRRRHVVAVGTGHQNRQRDSPLIGQGVTFRAQLAAVRRIGACLRPPKGALTITLSGDCQRHWMPRRSLYRVSSVAHNRWKTPARTHSWNRRWQVEPDPYSRGRAFH